MLRRLGFRLVEGRFNGFVGLYLRCGTAPGLGSPETLFETEDGRRIPVYPDYRYHIKKGWRFFEPLNALEALARRDLLAPEERAFFDRATGRRALGCPLEEITATVQVIARRLPGMFLPDSLEAGVEPVLRPPDADIERAIRGYVQMHQTTLATLRAAGIDRLGKGLRLLEVGYGVGGYTLHAWERLGFEATGVDIEWRRVTEYVSKRVGGRTRPLCGDVTARTPLDAGSFDVVYSASVLEHVLELPRAIAEMHRLLRPGGLLVHYYLPFFAVNGAHALGTLDAPWAHARLSDKDLARYIRTLRPHEAEVAEPWIAAWLTRAFPIARVQALLVESGFTIALWRVMPVSRTHAAALTREVLHDCFRLNPGISIEDLVAQDVFFVARKDG